MSSCKLVSVTDVASPMFCGHIHPVQGTLRNNNNNNDNDDNDDNNNNNNHNNHNHNHNHNNNNSWVNIPASAISAADVALWPKTPGLLG